MVKKKGGRPKLTDLDIGYVGGFLDGEGTVSCTIYTTKQGVTPYLRVAFSNFDPEPLRNIKRIWGGSLSEQKTEVWQLNLNGQAAARLCRDIQKAVIVKRRAVDAAVLMYENLDDRGLRLRYAVEVMEATRAGYKAERTSKMLDAVKEALSDHVRQNKKSVG